MGTRALVVGGTSGIGYAIACRIAAETKATVLISGRTNPGHIPHPNIKFRPLDASSMRSIKQYTDSHKALQEPELDLLVLSQGILSMAGRIETPEGIDRKMALHYYGRWLLIRELSPVLSKNARVVVILDAKRGSPDKLIWEDLDLKSHFSLDNVASHCISMTDGMIQYFAARQNAQDTARRHYVHAFPGFVKTSIYRDLPWFLKLASTAAGGLFATSPETCAENLLRGVSECTKINEGEGKFWTYIDNKGCVIEKPAWSDDQIRKVADHTWRIVDDALSKTS